MPDDYRCTDPYYTPSDCTSIHVSTICAAMCGKCIASQCKESSGTIHDIGDSWLTFNGKVVCTEKGLKTIRGIWPVFMASSLEMHLIECFLKHSKGK